MNLSRFQRNFAVVVCREGSGMLIFPFHLGSKRSSRFFGASPALTNSVLKNADRQKTPRRDESVLFFKLFGKFFRGGRNITSEEPFLFHQDHNVPAGLDHVEGGPAGAPLRLGAFRHRRGGTAP